MHFVSAGKPVTAFDDSGATAMECVAHMVEACRDEMLAALWNEVEEQGRGGEHGEKE